ncbi:cyclic-di-AMP-binding protein CbpB [Streptococcus hillyeri]|uniref:CBS domain-containing protein n=1 Tax=Streptococcus hillyeri TaxID=2282420 RepID=A0A3L9DM53_9STRE|nr:cyclic-di-AMP-binding protein CbpB [Streptococcus hillyeri]RLY01784.1 CBS domain-containing protein [Streptococcus hillyeri]
MIAKEFEIFLKGQLNTYLTPAEEVAIFVDTHNADHVLLLLASNGFSRVPVITKEKKYVGTISLSDIMKYQAENGLQDWEMAQTDIAHMANSKIPTVSINADVTEVLHKLVDFPFLPVLDAEQTFVGIITRKSILKAVNSLLHNFTKDYTIHPND